MINSKKVLAIILARKNSRELPNKNFKPFAHSNLTEIAIKVAKKSKFIDLVFLSSDIQYLTEICHNNSIENFGTRPSQLALDETTSYEVMRFSLDLLRKRGDTFEYIVLLEPTSPLRKVSDIDFCINSLELNCGNYDSLVTVGEVKAHPESQFVLDGSQLKQFNPNNPVPGNRQMLKKTYFPYGICYISKVAELFEHNSFYQSKTMAIVLPREQCIEIDDQFDFDLAEIIYKGGDFHKL